MKGRLLMEEMVDNKDRKFGAATEYFPVIVETVQGEEVPALFTIDQLNDAMERARKNPEDIPENGSLWDKIFG